MSDHPPIYDPFVARPPPAAPPPSTLAGEPPRQSGMALASLIFGVVGFTCLPAVGGLLALTLGIAAKSEISRSEGARTGTGLAITGSVLGVLNLIVSVVGLVALMSAIGSPSTASGPTPPSPIVSPPTPPVAPLPTAPTPAPTGSSATGAGAASREEGVTLTHVGLIDLVDVEGVRSLGGELDNQRKLASKDGKKLVLWLVVGDCQPCNGVAASLPDPKMQTALEKVRLVRVDAREYAAELSFLGLPSGKFPGFALLGDSNRPVDFVHGGEWDEDVARNIAPVLGNFVRGHYVKRRDPWRGSRRDDETTL